MPILRRNNKNIYFPQGASQDEVERALSLHQGEEALMDYHRSNLENPLQNPDGSSTTIWITGVEVDGEIYAVPGYDRDARRKMSPSESRDKWLSTIRENPNAFPHHRSGEEHNKWAQEFHTIIENTTE